MHEVPDIPEVPALFVHACGRHHEGHPAIRQQQQDGAEPVRHDADRRMDPLEGGRGHAFPTIVVGRQDKRLGHEHEGVDRHHRLERPAHVPHEARVQRDEQPQHEAAHHRGQGQCQQRDLEEIPGHPVVPSGPCPVAREKSHEFDDHAENRESQHEPAEIGVLLRHEPYEDSVVQRSIAGIDRGPRWGSRRSHGHTLGFVVHVRRRLWRRRLTRRMVQAEGPTQADRQEGKADRRSLHAAQHPSCPMGDHDPTSASSGGVFQRNVCPRDHTRCRHRVGLRENTQDKGAA